MTLAIIVPVLDEASTIRASLTRLRRLARSAARQSSWSTAAVAMARPRSPPASPTHVLAAPRGRAVQMNAGAQRALADPATDTLLFLHADTRLPDDADARRAAACGGRSLRLGSLRCLHRRRRRRPCRWWPR